MKNQRSRELSLRIRSLVRGNPHQMKVREYELIKEQILAIAPANCLIFGTGKDTGLWMSCNEGGRTCFLEDTPEWIEMARLHNPAVVVDKITYGTRREMWRTFLSDPDAFPLALPDHLLSTRWDLIFVDAPAGRVDGQPGRMQSIHAAWKLKPRHFFLHDCHREIERACFLHFFGKPRKKRRKLWYAAGGE